MYCCIICDCVYFILFIFNYSSVLWVLIVSPFLVTAGSGLMILLTILLIVAFIYKLCTLFRIHHDPELLQLMRKTAFLVFISTSCILFTAAANVLYLQYRSIHFQFLLQMVVTLDACSSFWCILLSFRYFTEYYRKICGGVESTCFRIICKRYMKSVDEENLSKGIESTAII